jgi:hypothetical protein
VQYSAAMASRAASLLELEQRLDHLERTITSLNQARQRLRLEVEAQRRIEGSSLSLHRLVADLQRQFPTVPERHYQTLAVSDLCEMVLRRSPQPLSAPVITQVLIKVAAMKEQRNATRIVRITLQRNTRRFVRMGSNRYAMAVS